jgi:hypothetical protein
MTISKTHKRFADLLENLDVLDHPENFLGPNWEAVINFWLYLDTISKKQSIVVLKRWRALSAEERCIYYSRAGGPARVTIKHSWNAVYSVYYDYVHLAAKYASLEIIGLDKLLAQGHQPVFFPMFLNL